MTGEIADGAQEERERCLVLCLGVLPTMHAVVEVDNGEGDVLEGGKLGDLPRESRVTNGGGR